ncbi:lipid II flippase MurJ [Ornithinimicrobium avium]|uniref:Protein kinase domain-containing protein n=1 Tax=Ornithinimicrobium avium TaxID=2283195 RepID=A0A345NP09_9MICO|nr:lipid II flippase MurJ [Ornithinimicrobium avium]AXH96767.1 hypothetical protein DV701_12120 [Ornithinimicrobium avium]
MSGSQDSSASRDGAASQGSAASLARSSLVMAGGTLVSRVLGLLRVSLLTAAIGLTTPAANVWQAANSLPNTIYVLLAAGVLNVVLLPQITRALLRGEQGKDYTDRLLTLALSVLVVGTVVFVAAAPFVTKLYNLEWPWGGPELSLAILFAYLCIPQILFYGLHTLMGQVLAAHHRFAAFMWSPALANVVALSGIVVFMRRYPGAAVPPTQGGIPLDAWTPGMIWLLAGSATLGILLQAVVLVPAVRSTGFTWRFRWGFRGVGLGSASRMAGWSLADVGLSQLGMLFVYNVLAWVAVAAPTAPAKAAYDNAFLIYILPHSLIALSLLTAIYPVLSKAAARDALDEMAQHTARGMRLLVTSMVPLALAMIVLAPYVVRVIFPENADPRDMAPILTVLTVGLVPYGVYLLCARVFYSFEDARTPLNFQMAITGVLLVVLLLARLTSPATAAVLVGAGQALGQTTAAVLGVRAVRRRLPGVDLHGVLRTGLRAVAAAAAAAVPTWLLMRVLVPRELVRTASIGLPEWLQVVVPLAACGILFLLVYAVCAHLLGVAELAEAAAPLLRRVPGGQRLLARSTSGEGSGEASGRGDDHAGGDRGDPGGGRAPHTEPSVPPGDDSGVLPLLPWHDIPWEGSGEAADEDHPSSASRAAEGSAAGTLGWDRPASSGDGGKDEDMDRLEVGTVLGERYALDELLARRDGGSLEYWSARDVTLGRLVAVTVLPATGEFEATAQAALDGARRVASVDDPRLVRVLDVGTEDGLSWVVEEGLSEAESLASLVAEEPLAAEEVRRIVGEAAAGLESARRRGLHHLYLNPHSVLRTSDGTVKISGVGVASALEGTDDVTSAEASIIDTADLVSLLYTGLTGRWPGEDLPGLRPARRLADGSLLAPSEVVGGVPGDLDALCRMVHGTDSAMGGLPRTPGELARQLAPWSSEMVRGTRPTSFSAPSEPSDRGAAPASSTASAVAAATHPTDTEHLPAGEGDDPDATTRVPRPPREDGALGRHDRATHGSARGDDRTGGIFGVGADDRAADPLPDEARGRPSAAELLGVRSTGERISPRTDRPVRPAPQVADRGAGPDASGLREERGTGAQTAAIMLVLVGLLGLVAVLGWSALRGLGDDTPPAGVPTTASATDGTRSTAGAGAAGEGKDGPTGSADAQDTPTAAAPAAGGGLPVLGIDSFDPQGDGDENAADAPLAVDGDPDTAWSSQTYLSPGWGGLKTGTGLVLDLGEGAQVSEVEVQLGEGDVGVTAYLADQPTIAGATELGSDDAASGTWTVTPDEPATGRYLVVWFTRAWTSPEGEVVSVREITVR